MIRTRKSIGPEEFLMAGQSPELPNDLLIGHVGLPPTKPPFLGL